VLGETIGNFKIVGKLGRGGMGEVWLAEQQNLGTRVAIKVLLEAFPADSEDVQRFSNEARAVSVIQHAGITKIFDSGLLPDGRAYLVMEYLDGESLTQRIARGALPIAALADIGRQLASVLDATHNAGITHRDLKPDNVFLVPDREQPRGERVKVLDFGVAKLTGTLAGNSPRTYGTLGTPNYMAPEQWGDASEVDGRADLYSLGCLAFEMACRRPPFPCKSVAEACAKHLNDTPVLASSIAPGLPPQLDQLIAQLLAKRPEDRPRSARAVTRVFEQIAAAGTTGIDPSAATLPSGRLAGIAKQAEGASSTGNGTTAVGGTLAMGEVSRRSAQTLPRRRRAGVLAGVIVGAVAVAGGTVAAVVGLRGPTPQPAAPSLASKPVVTAIVEDASTAGAARPVASLQADALANIVRSGSGSGSGSGIERAVVHHAPVAKIDRAKVLAAITAERSKFEFCNAHHDTNVRLDVAFTIGLDGRASAMSATGATDEIAGCALAVIRTIRFPIPTGGAYAMTVPLTFEAQPDPIAISTPAIPERLSNDQVAKGLLSAEKDLDACMVSNHVDERIVLTMTIDPSGRVTAADAQGKYAGTGVATCAFGVLREISFGQSRTTMKASVPVTPP
jgi:serine/threonine-protein kinase